MTHSPIPNCPQEDKPLRERAWTDGQRHAMTKYTAEEVRAQFEAAMHKVGYFLTREGDTYEELSMELAWIAYQAAYADLLERIKADEEAADYPECSGDPSSCPENEGRGCCKPNTPAQAAQADKPPRLGGCCCGEPCTLGVVHRTDGPCFHYVEPTAEPVAQGEAVIEDAVRRAAHECSKHAYAYWHDGPESAVYYEGGMPGKEAHEAPYAKIIRRAIAAQPAELPEFLKDPANVHVMMLRGAIAIPSIRSMVDLRGEVPNGEDAQLARIAELQEQVAALEAQPAGRVADVFADAENWGSALNSAAWVFTEVCPEKSILLFNNTKQALRAAILKYLEKVTAAQQAAR